MGKKEGYASELDPKVLKLKKEKLTHFHLYWHDTVGGRNPSSVAVLPSLKNGSTLGLMHMFDNPLSVGPDLKKSELVGRSQGIYASTALDQTSITILGRNAILLRVRELPIIGGSGRFRFARLCSCQNLLFQPRHF
ncbi:dirigent protein 7-like isoform X2 [Cucurbita pepo subsp. pepo]|uniref:dirigent protein 7-like isoform X2 n=1 Tax=Cucurbita pepo subsp. pepo TaxID=3664 RepID=UPI000C9D931B|nr:dirigent protein 7-like isoform X2 [Cucurbita pepo subsp. pepo]